MVSENIFTKPLFTDYILPWLLVFVIVFAILEKSKILGEGKRQINAIIGAVCGLLLLAFPASRDVVVKIIPVLVVMAVVIFAFLMLYGFASGETKGDPLGKGVKIAFGIGIFIILAAAVLMITGKWNTFWSFLSGSSTGSSILFVVVGAAAIAAVLFGGGKGDKKND